MFISDGRGSRMRHNFFTILGRFQSEPIRYVCKYCNKSIDYVLLQKDREEECGGYTLRIWDEVELC